MKVGIVICVNSQKSWCTLQVDDGSYSVVEIIDTYEVQLGEKLKGKLDGEGSCTLTSLNIGVTFDAVIQYAGCTRENALQKTRHQ